jgi:hypothetical protein
VHRKVVSEWLGHAGVLITLDTYSHAIPALPEEAAALIAGLVIAKGWSPRPGRVERQRRRSTALPAMSAGNRACGTSCVRSHEA